MGALLHGSPKATVRARLAPRLRRLLLLLAVTLLCCATYLAGIWVGSSGRMTCVTTQQQGFVCSNSGELPAPADPTLRSDPGSA